MSLSTSAAEIDSEEANRGCNFTAQLLRRVSTPRQRPLCVTETITGTVRSLRGTWTGSNQYLLHATYSKPPVHTNSEERSTPTAFFALQLPAAVQAPDHRRHCVLGKQPVPTLKAWDWQQQDVRSTHIQAARIKRRENRPLVDCSKENSANGRREIVIRARQLSPHIS